MEAPRHRPVLLKETVSLLAPRGRRRLLDATCGLGGHAETLLEAAGDDAQLIAIDLDEANLRQARQRLERFGKRVRLFQADHGLLPDVLAEAGWADAELILADLGISSNQLDDPQRGLGFAADGPLDMRLDAAGEWPTAAEVVNRLDADTLADLIYGYGDERYSRRIARAIVEARKSEPITRTAQLAEIVRRAYPAPARRSRRGVDPATRTFQALRIHVNDLLGALQRLLSNLPKCLAVGGRAGVISFHSLEDRPVKQAFRQWAETGNAEVVTPKPVTPGQDEQAENPRSRSAKLRVIQRIG